MSNTPGTRLPALLGFASILASTIFVITPSTIYLGNVDEFALTIGALLSHFALPAIVLVGVLTFVGVLIPTSLVKRYVTLIATLGIVVWIQGYILAWNYGQLDGRSIDWSVGRWRGVIDLAVWVLLLGAAILLPQKATHLLARFAVAIFCIQTASIALAAYKIGDDLRSKPSYIIDRAGESEMYRFSAQQNVLHILADGFQSDVFAEIIESPKNGKRYRDTMEGFTFFREHAGAFPLTHMSIPAIFSGQIYKNHIPRSDFLDQTLGGNSLQNVFYDSGFDVDMVIPIGGVTNIYLRSKYTNLYQISNSHHVRHADYETDEFAKLLDLALFRVSPHYLKQFVYNDQDWFIQPLLIDGATRGVLSVSHNAFLDDMSSKMLVDRPRPVYKLLHLMLSHNPMETTSDCNYAGKVLPTVRANVLNQARCSFENVLELFEQMKELGIYRNSTIVLMGDHGAWVPPKGLRVADPKGGATSRAPDPSLVAMALPLMAVKPAGASGPLTVSTAQTSIVETPITIASLMGLDANFDGISFFDLNPNLTRTRHHYSYRYSKSEWTADYLAPIQEWIITGSLFDLASWRRGDQYHPNGVLKAVTVDAP